ncbi:MAG: sensor histidine kinase, partial [Candidatus Adiutrix sp.]
LKAELAKNEHLAALGSLAAGLAHEIRNPLGAIRGLSQHLLSKNSVPQDAHASLEVMLNCVDRLNTTITAFLNYAKPANMVVRPVDLSALIRNMATLAAHDAESQKVDIVFDLPWEPVIIHGDESLLSQAFLNIYLNAIWAAGKGPKGQLTVAMAATKKEVILTFHDNGPGFSPGQLAQPFVPYFTTKAEGSGLGLALVEKTIRAHKGASITLGTPPSGGALVTIIFKIQVNHE